MDKTQLYDRAYDAYRQYVISNLTAVDLMYYQDHELDIYDEFEDVIKEYNGDIERVIKDYEI
jgi:hypothetical protein